MRNIIIALGAALLLAACGRIEPVEQSSEVSSEVETTGSQEETKGEIWQALSSLNWDAEAVLLPRVQELLDQENITYEGTFNCSGERLDMVLEDGTRLMFLAVTDSENNPAGYELMMFDETFNRNGFQENYLNQYDVTCDEEYYPQTAGKIENINNAFPWSQTDSSIARNEIYARHGRQFEDPFLDAVFRVKTWYQPEYDKTEFAALEAQLLNSYEKENLKLLVEKERELGYRQGEGENYDRAMRLLSGSWLDLDWDGTKEQVRYAVEQTDSYGADVYEVNVNGRAQTKDGMTSYPELYAASLNGTATQLLAAQNGDNDYDYIYVYAYENGELKEVGELPGSPSRLQIIKGGVYTFTSFDHFQSRIAKRQYTYEDGVVREVPRDFYEHGNEAVALTEIPLYESREGGAIGLILKAGDPVIILGGDNKEWICIQKKDGGQQGWLRVEQPHFCQLPDGRTVAAPELFEGLTYFG